MNISENGIHSIRTRVKDAEHLIVKIIRKRQENYKKYRTLDKDNYEKFLIERWIRIIMKNFLQT
ncbi:hypothetical protein DWY47_12900 [Ruminococcus sp. AF25-23LB]|nr:hypothetical protein DWY47_12900 [Ruminococcus sp. AF25-23LB]